MSMRQQRARLEKLEAELPKRMASARAAEAEKKERERRYALLHKREEERTPEEQKELSGLDLVWNEKAKRYIVLNEDPHYSVILAYRRVLKEA
jgi:hypothetical protein